MSLFPSPQKKNNWILGLFLLTLTFSLTWAGCTKKDDPNVDYGEGSGSGSQSGSGYGESNIEGSGGYSSSSSGLNTIYFGYDSVNLSSGARNTLRDNAKFIKKSKKSRVLVEGHCDERGSNEYNLALGERRANTVRDYLANLGVSKSRLKAVSYGEERPANSGNSETAWSKNRRVEFISQ